MSVTGTQSLFQYAIAALGQAFTPACPVQNTSDFAVTYTNSVSLLDTTLVLNVDYFVTGAATAGVILAPTVTLEATGLHYAVGGTLTIQRKNPFTQPTTYVDGVKYLAAVPNNSLDWLCYSIQALNDLVARCLQVPATSPAQAAIPLAPRKGQLIGFDANGNFTTYTLPGNGGIQPFPPALAPSFPIFLPGVTATTGGTSTCLDGLNITAVAQIIAVMLSIGDNQQVWKLRPFIFGDSNVSDRVSVVVPVINPANLRWIRIS